MVKQILNKIIAIFIIMLLAIINILPIATKSYAAFEELEEQKSITSDKNVSFDAFFVVEEKNTHSIFVNTQDEAIINFEVNVSEGYLKGSTIELRNSNFEIISIESQSIDSLVNTFEKNKIILNQISSKTKAIISAKIKINHSQIIDIDYLAKETNVEFTSSYTNIKGKALDVNSNIIVRVDYTADAKTIIDTNVQKYMILGNKTVIQTKVTSGIVDNVLPIKNTNIKVQVPQINNSLAQDVRVAAVNTVATNGIENGNYFTNQNYTYNNETGIVEINVENLPNNENKISWKDGVDEYIVTFVYENNENISNIELKASSNITTYKNIEVKNEITKSQEVNLNGNNVDFILDTTKSLSKGYMYAGSNYETQYKSIWSANISYADFTDALVFAQDTDKFIQQDGKDKYVNSYYKQTKINKVNFNKILGEQGQAQILSGDKLVGIINKDTSLDENGNYVFNFNEHISNIKIQTTKPVSEGKIIIENTKMITATSPYNVNQIKSFVNIETNLVGNSLAQYTQDIKQVTNLLETTTKASMQIGRENLSTVVTNEDVEIRAVLESDDMTDDLYKNPTLEISLPQEVENINIKSANILFTNQMEITKIEIINNHIIKIGLTGEQTQFITDGNKGITIILNTDLNLNKTATNKQTQVIMKVTNEKMIDLENEGISSVNTNIVAPTGVIALNSVTNKLTGKTATSLESKQEEVELERNMQSQIATYKQTIINNTNNTISNVKVIGTIPTKQDKYGSTIDTKLIEAINSIEQIDCTVYYSENLNATSDLENEKNGWTNQITQNSKSYLIVVNEDINQARELNFTYDVELPENLNYGAKAISSYKVEYEEGKKDQGQIASIQNTNVATYSVAQENNRKNVVNTEEATKVSLTTGEGAILEATLEDNTVDGTVYTGQVVTYTVTVTNKGTEDAENVKVNAKVPEGMVYTQYKEAEDEINQGEYIEDLNIKNVDINIGKIEKNETKTVNFYLNPKVNQKTVIQVEISQNEQIVSSDKIENNIEKSILNMSMELGTKKDIIISNRYKFQLKLSKQENDIENITIKIKIPDNIEIEKVYINDDELDTTKFFYDERNREIITTIDKVEEDVITIFVKSPNLGSSGNIYAIVEYEDMKQYSNVASVNVYDINATATVISNKGEYIKAGEEIQYTFEIKNQGDVTFKDFIRMNIADELIYESVNIDNKNIPKEDLNYSNSNNSIAAYVEIEPNSSKIIHIQCKVYEKLELYEDREVQVITNIEKIKFKKEFSYIIEANMTDEKEDPEKPVDPDNPDIPPISKTYKISGTAWLDKNKDGSMNKDEIKLSGITVKAIDQNGTQKAQTTTKEDGTYILEKLEDGKYTVIFEYDTSRYLLTAYQKEGIEESISSNVVKGTFNNKEVGTTDIITIIDRSIANINIGLVEGSNFDLSLDKKVIQISMANTKATSTKAYDTKLAKIDLDYKYINSTNLAIKYEITVTNEGDIPGTATKIVDYIPKEFDFSTELNKDWYTSGQNIETKALADTIINPGESASITLVLTKSMTESDNGIYANTAEIADIYNEFGEEDSDSIPGNNKEGEDDISTANVILGLKTGGPITYITLTLTIMTLICIGAYELNKRVLKI